MRSRALSWTLAITLVVLLIEVRPGGQQPTAPAPRQSAAWVLPRTADGHPDLEGVWENNSATPLERPAQLAQKPRLSDDELAALERRASRLLGPDAEAVFGDQLYLTLLADAPPEGLGATGTYSQNWLPDRYFEHRTSLIVDPADGKLPPPTPAGAKLRASMRRSGQPADAVQGMSLQDRCIHYGFPDLFAGYMSVYRIVQSPGQVAMTLEKIHDTRIIPLDGRPHVSPAVRQYLGDSRGRWEGDTLVVETTNFHPNGQSDGRLLGAVGRRSAPDRTIPADGRGHDRVHLHGRRPDDVDEAVDGGDQLEAVARRAVRVRLSRRQLQPARHAVGHAGSGSQRAAIALPAALSLHRGLSACTERVAIGGFGPSMPSR